MGMDAMLEMMEAQLAAAMRGQSMPSVRGGEVVQVLHVVDLLTQTDENGQVPPWQRDALAGVGLRALALLVARLQEGIAAERASALLIDTARGHH